MYGPFTDEVQSELRNIIYGFLTEFISNLKNQYKNKKHKYFALLRDMTSYAEIFEKISNNCDFSETFAKINVKLSKYLNKYSQRKTFE